MDNKQKIDDEAEHHQEKNTKKKSTPIVHPWQILAEEAARLDAKRRKEKNVPDLLFSTEDIVFLNSLGFPTGRQQATKMHTDIDYLFGVVGKGNYLQISVNVNAPPLEAYKGARHPHTVVLHERTDSDGADFAQDNQPNFLMLYHDDERNVPAIPNGSLVKSFFYNKQEMQAVFDKEISSTFSNSNIYTLTDGGAGVRPDVTIYHINGQTKEKTRVDNEVVFKIPKITTFMDTHAATIALMIGMSTDRVALIASVLEQDDISQNIPSNYTFPHQMIGMAVEKNAVHVVDYLLDQVKTKGLQQETKPEFYLFVAAREGYIDMMDLLLKRGANPSTPVASRGHQLPIHAAVINNRLEAVEKLLAVAPETLNKTANSGDVPLVLAVAHGHDHMVKYLVTKGADVNAVDGNGHVAIVSAARAGSINMVQYLYAHGADIEPINNPAITPFVAAAALGKAQMVTYLRPFSDINQQDITGRTALAAAAQHGHEDIVAYLITEGAAVDIRDDYGENAYRQAVKSGHFSIAQDLADAGADPFVQDVEGKDILTRVKEWGYHEAEKFCLKIMRKAEQEFIENGGVQAWRLRRDTALKPDSSLRGMDM